MSPAVKVTFFSSKDTIVCSISSEEQSSGLNAESSTAKNGLNYSIHC